MASVPIQLFSITLAVATSYQDSVSTESIDDQPPNRGAAGTDVQADTGQAVAVQFDDGRTDEPELNGGVDDRRIGDRGKPGQEGNRTQADPGMLNQIVSVVPSLAFASRIACVTSRARCRWYSSL